MKVAKKRLQRSIAGVALAATCSFQKEFKHWFMFVVIISLVAYCIKGDVLAN